MQLWNLLLAFCAYNDYLTAMDTIYKAGTFVTAQNDPENQLVINRYLDRIYYCEAVNDPTHKLLAYFERELIPPVATLKS
jgi:hypothetical protein